MRKLAATVVAIFCCALLERAVALADDLSRQCQDPRIVASCPISCRAACADRDVFRTAKAECMRAEDPAVREDSVACKSAMAKTEAKPTEKPTLPSASLPAPRSMGKVDVCIGYLQEKVPGAGVPANQANDEDDLIAKVFADRPQCATSTRALLKGFTCMQEGQSEIEQTFNELSRRIPVTENSVKEVCSRGVEGIDADRSTAADLEQRAKSIVANLQAVGICSAAYAKWLSESEKRCPNSVEDCGTFVHSWIEIFQGDLKKFENVGNKIADAQKSLKRIRNAASMLSFIYSQTCNVKPGGK
jgi:hypothetical protein